MSPHLQPMNINITMNSNVTAISKDNVRICARARMRLFVLWAYSCPLGLFGRNSEPVNGFYGDSLDGDD
jgi:hypothetical protein